MSKGEYNIISYILLEIFIYLIIHIKFYLLKYLILIIYIRNNGLIFNYSKKVERSFLCVSSYWTEVEVPGLQIYTHQADEILQ